MKKIFLVEDEWVHAEDIRITIEELGYEWTGYSPEGVDALQKIIKLQPDVVLIDLNLNGAFSGIAIARQLKQQKPRIPFIFTTSHIDDNIIQQCLEEGPTAYLHKPVNKGDLKAALLKAVLTTEATVDETDEAIASESDLQMLIRVGNHLKLVLKEDITVVQSDVKNYIRIHTKQKTNFSIKLSLTVFEKKLPPNLFMRVHKEYLINLKSIIGVNESEQTIQIDQQHIPLGKNYRTNFMARFNIL
jgi:DNA-binding LytR/AlgR family response regulator